MRIKTLLEIEKGEEILVSYSPNFFDENNKNCRCLSCQITKSLPPVQVSPLAAVEVNMPTATAELNQTYHVEVNSPVSTSVSPAEFNPTPPVQVSREVSTSSPPAAKQNNEGNVVKNQKKLKTNPVVQCLVCDSMVKYSIDIYCSTPTF